MHYDKPTYSFKWDISQKRPIFKEIVSKEKTTTLQ